MCEAIRQDNKTAESQDKQQTSASHHQQQQPWQQSAAARWWATIKWTNCMWDLWSSRQVPQYESFSALSIQTCYISIIERT